MTINITGFNAKTYVPRLQREYLGTDCMEDSAVKLSWTGNVYKVAANSLLVIVRTGQIFNHTSINQLTISSNNSLTFTRHVANNTSDTSPTFGAIYTAPVTTAATIKMTYGITVSVNESLAGEKISVLNYTNQAVSPIGQTKLASDTTVANSAFSYNMDAAVANTSDLIAFYARDFAGGSTFNRPPLPGTGFTDIYGGVMVVSFDYGVNHHMVKSNPANNLVNWAATNPGSITYFQDGISGAVEIKSI